MSELIQSAVGQGIFAVLFVYLLLLVLKQNEKREDKYQSIIDELSKNYSFINGRLDKIEVTLERISEGE